MGLGGGGPINLGGIWETKVSSRTSNISIMKEIIWQWLMNFKTY